MSLAKLVTNGPSAGAWLAPRWLACTPTLARAGLAPPPSPQRGQREGGQPAITRSPRPGLRTATRLAIRRSSRPRALGPGAPPSPYSARLIRSGRLPWSAIASATDAAPEGQPDPWGGWQLLWSE